MFKSILYTKVGSASSVYKEGSYYYGLKDTNFISNVSFTIPSPHGISSYTGSVVAVLREYKKKNLPVSKNLALLYRFYEKQGYDVRRWFNHDRNNIDHCLPELEYGKKYYPCVLNTYHILKLTARK